MSISQRGRQVGKGYTQVEGEGAQAANEPGQVVDDVAALALAAVRVLQQHAQAIRGVSHDDQCKQEVRHALRRLPLVLQKKIKKL